LYESAEQLGSEHFLLGLARTLPRLHAMAVELPHVESPLDDLVDKDLHLDKRPAGLRGLLHLSTDALACVLEVVEVDSGRRPRTTSEPAF
jgi:hypothetical protein